MATAQARRHKERRRVLRRRLEALGLPQQKIDRLVDELRRRQEAARRAGVTLPELDEIHDRTWAERRLDDRGYRPTSPDPLLRGPGRVSEATARAARRRKATTRHEYDRQETSR